MRLLTIMNIIFFVTSSAAMDQSFSFPSQDIDACLKKLQYTHKELFKIYAYFGTVKTAKTFAHFNNFIEKLTAKNATTSSSTHENLLEESLTSGFICATNFFGSPIHAIKTRRQLKKAMLNGTLRNALNKHRQTLLSIKKMSENKTFNAFTIHEFAEKLDFNTTPKDIAENMITTIISNSKAKISFCDFITMTMYRSTSNVPYYFILDNIEAFSRLTEKLDSISGADLQRMVDCGLSAQHTNQLVHYFYNQNPKLIADASFIVQSLATVRDIEALRLPEVVRWAKISPDQIKTILQFISDYFRANQKLSPFYENLFCVTLKCIKSLEILLDLRKDWEGLIAPRNDLILEHPLITRMIELGGTFNVVFSLWAKIHNVSDPHNAVFFKTSLISLIENKPHLLMASSHFNNLSDNIRLQIFLDYKMLTQVIDDEREIDEVLSLLRVPEIHRSTTKEQIKLLLDKKHMDRKLEEHNKLLLLLQTTYNSTDNFYDSFPDNAPQKVRKSKKIECGICLSEYSEDNFVVLREHKHAKFCESCWHDHVNTQINDGTHQIPCMKYGCQKFLKYKDLLHLCDDHRAISQDQIRLLRDRSLRGFLQVQENWSPCRGLNCGMGKFVLGNDYYFDCENCGFQGCLNCNHNHRGQDCNKYIEDENIVRSSWIQNGVAPCPVCKTKIQKNEGCSSVHCTVCKNSFDWEKLTITHHHRQGTAKYVRTQKTEIDELLPSVLEK